MWYYDKGLQRKILCETELTFKQALDIALAQEAADRNAQELEQATPSQAVHDMPRPPIKGGGHEL